MQKTAASPQLHFIEGRRFPCRGVDADSMVQTARLTMEIPQFVFDKMIDVPVVQVRASSSGAVVEETAEFGVSTASCGMKLALGAGRALCTGTGPGFDPRHQGGEGVAGSPGVSLPGDLAP